MPTRYADEPEYGREPARGIRRERDGRDVREREVVREVPRERRTMEVDQPRISRIPEQDLIRGEQQRIANSGVPRQQDTRTVVRTAPPPREREDDMMYDARPPPQFAPIRDQREPARRTPYEGEFDDIPASIRPVIDPGRSRDEPRPNYNEYFLPGDGIDREVIQSEICRYLGQDATCKPGTHHDGRRGFIIRAYRALTTEMIRSLKEDSGKYAREKENAVRRNRQPASFATIRDSTRYGGDDIMVDAEPEERFTRYEDPRARAPAATAPTYIPESGYPSAYLPISAAQPPPPGVDSRMDHPRYIPGNSTPPSGRTPGYQSQGYPPVTSRPSIPAIPAGGAFPESRMAPLRESGYPPYAESRPRHR